MARLQPQDRRSVTDSSRAETARPMPGVSGDTDEYGHPLDQRYERLGATGRSEGLYVRFEPGFGLNVYLGLRIRLYTDDRVVDHKEVGGHEFGMSIDGWERLCELVDEYREREARVRASDEPGERA